MRLRQREGDEENREKWLSVVELQTIGDHHETEIRKLHYFVQVLAAMSLCGGVLLIATAFAHQLPLEGVVAVMIAAGLMGAAFNLVVVAAVLELLSDIEFGTRKPELPQAPAVARSLPLVSPYNRPHALNVADAERTKEHERTA